MGDAEQLSLVDAPEGGGIPEHEFLSSASGWTWARLDVIEVVLTETTRGARWLRIPHTGRTAEGRLVRVGRDVPEYGDLVALGVLSEKTLGLNTSAPYIGCQVTAAGRRENKRVRAIMPPRTK